MTESLTPPDIARELKIKPSKVLAWIASGELVAFNVATKLGGRPRWRVPRPALDTFLAGRQCRRQPAGRTRRRRQPAVIEFF